MEPLASKIRPQNLDEFVGQQHLVGPSKPLAVAIQKKHLFSFVLWGPPGVGKTTLAKIYAQALDAVFFELSAVSAGKDDIRKIIALETTRPKVLFLDEIHRFNKAQQDFLLPYVERGDLTLIGATTENPSFEVISPLLSRCRVFVLNEFNEEEMAQIIDRAGFSIDAEAKDWLIAMANGDARQALTMLEATAQLYKTITLGHLKETLQSKFLRFDKKGEEHYNTISAFIKSMRASQPNAALYYLARMIDAGEDPKFIARRMVIFASEDIGMALPTALVVANEVFKAVEMIGLPECAINLAHGVVYLSVAPKSKHAYEGLMAAMADVKRHGNLSIPLVARNASTKLMKELGYGKGYERYPKEDLLPEKLQGTVYWKSPAPLDRPKSAEKPAAAKPSAAKIKAPLAAISRRTT
jgi:putative ATPase